MDYPYITLVEVQKLDYESQNALIAKIDLKLIGHFGNDVSLEVRLSDGRVLFGKYNVTGLVGILLKLLFDLLDLSEEDGKCLSDVRNVPCRVLLDSQGTVVGIGHFMKDCFVCEEDFFQRCFKMGEPF